MTLTEKIEAYLRESLYIVTTRKATLQRMARELAALMEPDAGKLRAAFLEGGKWWEWESSGGFSMQQRDENRVYSEALRRYPDTPKGDESWKCDVCGAIEPTGGVCPFPTSGRNETIHGSAIFADRREGGK